MEGESPMFADPLSHLTAFQRDILYVIDGMELGQPHGLGIKSVLDVHYEDKVNHGRLYPNLDSLVDEGYLEKGQLDKRTNYYELTASGEEALNAHREFVAGEF